MYAKPGSKDDDVSWMQLADDSWTINMNGLKMGEKDIAIKSTQMMLDSGLSYNMVPQEDITLIEDALKDQGIACKEQHGGDLDLYECECSQESYDKLKPLETKIGDKTVALPVRSFLKRKDNGACTLLMYPNDVSQSVEFKWVMGDLFMQNYYSIFDYKNKRIGLIDPKVSA